jgi:hypothetical protein
MLKRVSAAVEQESKGAQEPWTEGSIRGEFLFKSGPPVQVASVRPEPVVPAAPAVVAEDADTVLWNAIAQSANANDYRAYLGKYPNGKYAVLAQSRVASIGSPDTAQGERQSWQAALRGGQSELDAYLARFPAGEFVGQARAKLRGLSSEFLVSAKTRSEVQASRALFPSTEGTKVLTLSFAGNLYFDKRFSSKIQKIDGLCRWEMDFGVNLFYYGAGALLAGAPDGSFVADRNALAAGQKFAGSISAMSNGQSLTAELSGGRLAGETRVVVGDSKDSWPEFNFPYAGIRLVISRDYETLGGYTKSDEVAIYSPAVGCAVPVTQDVTVINGNRLFGEKTKFALKLSSATMADR